MQQVALFHDSITDAIGADIAVIGGIKKVAGLLWPSLASDSGSAKLRACLNEDQPHKLDPQEVMIIKRLARDAGSTATVDYESQQLGYRTEWTSPENDQARLMREFISSIDKLDRIKRDMQRNDSRLASVRA